MFDLPLFISHSFISGKIVTEHPWAVTDLPLSTFRIKMPFFSFVYSELTTNVAGLRMNVFAEIIKTNLVFFK